MEFKIEELENGYLINLAGVSVMCSLSDLKNLKSHLQYFLDNEHVTTMGILLGDEE